MSKGMVMATIKNSFSNMIGHQATFHSIPELIIGKATVTQVQTRPTVKTLTNGKSRSLFPLKTGIKYKKVITAEHPSITIEIRESLVAK